MNNLKKILPMATLALFIGTFAFSSYDSHKGTILKDASASKQLWKTVTILCPIQPLVYGQGCFQGTDTVCNARPCPDLE